LEQGLGLRQWRRPARGRAIADIQPPSSFGRDYAANIRNVEVGVAVWVVAFNDHRRPEPAENLLCECLRGACRAKSVVIVASDQQGRVLHRFVADAADPGLTCLLHLRMN
jgi:hypothetical protein